MRGYQWWHDNILANYQRLGLPPKDQIPIVKMETYSVGGWPNTHTLGEPQIKVGDQVRPAHSGDHVV